MKTPKIGDIVWYINLNKNIWPAIITHFYADKADLLVFNIQMKHLTSVDYSLFHREQHWSWPEEEKQCEHTSQTISYLNYGERTRIECKQCGWVYEQINNEDPQEKPKECEHHYDGYNVGKDQHICGKCGHEKLSPPQSKAEKLIDEILRKILDTPIYARDLSLVSNIENLIKEYKGVK